MGFGLISGDWIEAEEKTKRINIIEPVVEGTLQLFFQSIILYSTVGSGNSIGQGQQAF